LSLKDLSFQINGVNFLCQRVRNMSWKENKTIPNLGYIALQAWDDVQPTRLLCTREQFSDAYRMMVYYGRCFKNYDPRFDGDLLKQIQGLKEE
jgi:hypothetical protein